MGGMATRAPVLAALFLIVTLATLAMPGSANFVGEFFILNGLFQAKVVYAIVAIAGVAMAAYYALRLYQRTMHNRGAGGVESREIGLRDGAVLVPLVALHRRAGAVSAGDSGADRQVGEPSRRLTCAARPPAQSIEEIDEDGSRSVPSPLRSTERLISPAPAPVSFAAPEIDYAALSPIIALTAGICVVLLSGVSPLRRSARRR